MGDELKERLLQRQGEREETEPLSKRVWNESKKMWVVAAPAIFTRFSTFGIQIVSQAFIGHIGSIELAAYAIVMTVLIRFANGVLLGMASALETLCGQAYGAKQYEMLGIYLQRSWIVLFLTALIMLPIYIFTTPILEFLGQDTSIAEVAGSISLWAIGQLGFVMLKCPETWKGFSFLAFKDLWPIIKLSLSSGAMLCLELWYNTILVLLTGNMKNAKVSIDALSICLNINGWEMMIALGFFAAASVRVSNELGRGSSREAKFAIVVTVLTSFGIGFMLFLVFLFLRERLAYIFTPNPEVAAAVGDLSPLLAFSMLMNSIQPVLSGVSIGAGWQSIVAYVNISCYYLIGIPVGVVLGKIIHLQVKGIWIGMLFGTFVQTVVLIIITYRTDWDKQVEIAKRRVKKWAVVEDTEE